MVILYGHDHCDDYDGEKFETYSMNSAKLKTAKPFKNFVK